MTAFVATIEIPGARRVSWAAASVGSAVVVAVGVGVLIGWAAGVDALKSAGPGLVAMKANTALCFVLLGAATWTLRRDTRPQRALRRVAAAVAVIVGMMTLAEYAFGLDLGIDQVVFREPAGAIGTSNPGRMAPTTALCVVLVGWALASRGALRSVRFRRTDALVIAAGAITFLAFVGYLYGATALYGLGSFPMAVHTSATFLVLCFSVIAIAPERSIAAVLLRSSPGGMVARRLVPAAFVAPITVGAIELLGERAGLYDSAFGLAMVVVAHVTIFTAIAGWLAWTLDHEHSRRLTAERTAATDALTGLVSRRAITTQLDEMVAKSGRGAAPFSVLAIDADGLKHINDRHGHAAGDAALLRLARVIRMTLRDIDVAGRVGGDEFVALLPATSAREAKAVSERLRDALEQRSSADDGVLTLRASIGVSVWSEGLSAVKVLEAADQALYEAKRTAAIDPEPRGTSV